jgi:hypothetical protein
LGWSRGRRTTCGAPRPRSSIAKDTRWNRRALLAHTRKGVTAIYARWKHLALKREMSQVVERSIRELLAGEPTTAAAKTAA